VANLSNQHFTGVRSMLGLLLLFGTFLGGCHVEVEGHRVANQSDQTLEIVWLHGGSEMTLGDVPPGQFRPLTLFQSDECSSGILVARGAAGREVARRTEPLCPADTWVIADPSGSG
jgi:hypothetical protein